MTTRSANRAAWVIFTSLLWMTGFLFMLAAFCGAHAEQYGPARAATFGYVTNADDNTISVIDTASNKVVATIPVGTFPSGVAITPDDTQPLERDDRRHQPHVYVTNSNDKTVSVIDTANNKVVVTIPVGGGPFDVAFTPDGTHAYVTNQFDNTVPVIDTANNKVVATIQVGPFPTGVVIKSEERHPSFAYVTNQLDTTVSVIDTARNKVVGTIPVGAFPFAVAFATVTPSQRNSQQ